MSRGTLDVIAEGLEKLIVLSNEIVEGPEAAELRENLAKAIEQRRESLAAVVDAEAAGGAQTPLRFRELDDTLARAAPLLGFDHPAVVRLSKASVRGEPQWQR